MNGKSFFGMLGYAMQCSLWSVYIVNNQRAFVMLNNNFTICIVRLCNQMHHTSQWSLMKVLVSLSEYEDGFHCSSEGKRLDVVTSLV